MQRNINESIKKLIFDLDIIYFLLKINIILDSSGNELINGKMERLSKLVCENLIACPEFDSGSGLWGRIMMEYMENRNKGLNI